MKALKVSPAQRRLLDAIATGTYGRHGKSDRYLWKSVTPCQDMNLITYEGVPGQGRWMLTDHGRLVRDSRGARPEVKRVLPEDTVTSIEFDGGGNGIIECSIPRSVLRNAIQREIDATARRLRNRPDDTTLVTRHANLRTLCDRLK